MTEDNHIDASSVHLSSRYGSPTLEEAAAECFSIPHSSKSMNTLNDDLIAWFAADKGANIPPSFLLDVVLALAGDQFLSTRGLGSRLLTEFGSIGNVLAADTGRLFCWLQQEGEANWFIEQLNLRLKATAALMKQNLEEEIADKPIISSWSMLLDYLKIVMGSEPIEHFRVLFLDKKNILVKDEVQQRGTVGHTPLYPREIAKRSLELCASAIIMVHNHPSGDPTPSRADIEMTKQVEAALNPLRVALHDHLIIGSKRYLSFKTEGLL